MRCLITGANGFIGQHLVKALENRGDRVTKIPRGTLLSTPELSLLTQKCNPDYIFHLAAYGNMANQTGNDQVFTANLWGTYALLEVAKDIPYKAFINVSSSSVLLPHQTIYSATKMGGEYLCKAYADEYNKPIVSVRPTSVYGPGEADFRFIPTVFRSCLTGEAMNLDPGATHDWVYVEDVVDCMIELADRIPYATIGDSLNISSETTVPNREIVSIIEEITGKKASITITEKMRTFDNDKWSVETGFEDYRFLNLRAGLEKCYPYYKERYATK